MIYAFSKICRTRLPWSLHTFNLVLSSWSWCVVSLLFPISRLGLYNGCVAIRLQHPLVRESLVLWLAVAVFRLIPSLQPFNKLSCLNPSQVCNHEWEECTWIAATTPVVHNSAIIFKRTTSTWLDVIIVYGTSLLSRLWERERCLRVTPCVLPPPVHCHWRQLGWFSWKLFKTFL